MEAQAMNSANDGRDPMLAETSHQQVDFVLQLQPSQRHTSDIPFIDKQVLYQNQLFYGLHGSQ
jgi:hypothetical protein